MSNNRRLTTHTAPYLLSKYILHKFSLLIRRSFPWLPNWHPLNLWFHSFLFCTLFCDCLEKNGKLKSKMYFLCYFFLRFLCVRAFVYAVKMKRVCAFVRKKITYTGVFTERRVNNAVKLWKPIRIWLDDKNVNEMQTNASQLSAASASDQVHSIFLHFCVYGIYKKINFLITKMYLIKGFVFLIWFRWTLWGNVYQPSKKKNPMQNQNQNQVQKTKSQK